MSDVERSAYDGRKSAAGLFDGGMFNDCDKRLRDVRAEPFDGLSRIHRDSPQSGSAGGDIGGTVSHANGAHVLRDSLHLPGRRLMPILVLSFVKQFPSVLHADVGRARYESADLSRSQRDHADGSARL